MTAAAFFKEISQTPPYHYFASESKEKNVFCFSSEKNTQQAQTH
jgi:hypothetical protein